jgi:P27 family predicted phage terminase small subunit
MLAVEDKIYQFLRLKGQLEDIDTTLIDELLFNIELSNQCKEDLRNEGYRINVTVRKNGKPYWVKSQAFNAYQSCLKNINMILISLGMTVRERQKLKLALNDLDNFDKIMDM